MTHFDPSHDMPAAQRRREDILSTTTFDQKWVVDSEEEKRERSRRYVAFRESGMTDDEAFDAVFAEMAADGVLAKLYRIDAYDADCGDIAALRGEFC